MIKYYLSLGIDKDLKDGSGRSPLHHAVIGDATDVVKYLISIKADQNLKDKYGRTPLHYAYFLNYDHLCKYFISIGADQTIKDIDDKTPIELQNLFKTDESKFEEICETIPYDFFDRDF